MRILIVGERANRFQPAFGRQSAGTKCHVLQLLAMGAFKYSDEPSPVLRRLRLIVPTWDASMNLVWPALSFVPWDRTEARLNAVAADGYIAPEFDVVVLCGRRVQRAFEGLSSSTYFPCPHPSGLCRAWNDAEAITRIKEQLDDVTSRTRGRTTSTPRERTERRGS